MEESAPAEPEVTDDADDLVGAIVLHIYIPGGYYNN